MESYGNSEQFDYDEQSENGDGQSVYFDSASNNGDFSNQHNTSMNFENRDERFGQGADQLEKLVELEKAETNELAAACEELDRAIDNYMLFESLDQQFDEIEHIMEQYKEWLTELETNTKGIKDSNEIILTVAKEREQYLSLYDEDSQGLLVRMNDILENFASRLREFATLKKAAETRHTAEMQELGSDINNMRSAICGIEKRLSEDRNRLNSLNEETTKLAEEIEESDKRLNEATHNYEELLAQAEATKVHDPDEILTLENDMKIMDERRDSSQLCIEEFGKGQTDAHQQLEIVKEEIETYRGEKLALKQKILTLQKNSEKQLDPRMTELKEINKKLSDAMDNLNFARQKCYTERLDFDYMISKNQLDFEKLVAFGDEKLNELAAVVKDLKRQTDELRDMKRQLVMSPAKTEDNDNDKDELHLRKMNKTMF